MKRYHPLEYAASCLRNAKDDEQTVEVLRELTAEGVSFVPFDIDKSGADWAVADGALIGGFKNLIGVGPAKSVMYRDKRDAGTLTDKDRAALAKLVVKHRCLTPAHALWGDIYDNPDAYNVAGKVKQFAELEDFEDAVVICNLVRVERRDENEDRRVHKRGNVMKGKTLFLDMFVVDDSVSKPVTIRVKIPMWESFGVKIADRAIAKQDWFLVRGKWLKQFSMMSVTKIKCLTNEEMFL